MLDEVHYLSLMLEHLLEPLSIMRLLLQNHILVFPVVLHVPSSQILDFGVVLGLLHGRLEVVLVVRLLLLARVLAVVALVLVFLDLCEDPNDSDTKHHNRHEPYFKNLDVCREITVIHRDVEMTIRGMVLIFRIAAVWFRSIRTAGQIRVNEGLDMVLHTKYRTQI